MICLYSSDLCLFSPSLPIIIFKIIFLSLPLRYYKMAFSILVLLESIESEINVIKKLKIYVFPYTIFETTENSGGEEITYQEFLPTSGWFHPALKWPWISNPFLSQCWSFEHTRTEILFLKISSFIKSAWGHVLIFLEKLFNFLFESLSLDFFFQL